MPSKRSKPFVSTRQRNFVCGEVYHIFQRGNHEAKVFSSDFERVCYLERFFMLCRRHKVRVHNFVLMGNHIHFVLEQLRKGAISKVMHDLQGPYARSHNLLVNKSGNLWTQHYGCKHVDSEDYYRTLMHYVENNPVKTGPCAHATEYKWSGAQSHAANCNQVIVAEGQEVAVDLFFDYWRKLCGPERESGWPQFLQSEAIDAEMKEKIELILDGKARQRLANLERIKREQLARQERREFDELVLKVGPGQARKMWSEKMRARGPGTAEGAGTAVSPQASAAG